MEIFLDYARRLQPVSDKDGKPLVKLVDAERSASRLGRNAPGGRPCDYTGLSYDKLRGRLRDSVAVQRSGRQTGTERLYADLTFPTFAEFARTTDMTSRPVPRCRRTTSKRSALRGRAILKAAEWTPPHEWAGDEYPFALVTGRTVFHFHTRTKTGRTPQLEAAAPEAWVELCADRRRAPRDLGRRARPRLVAPGHDRGTCASRRPREGVVFVPSHYGYWDIEDDAGPGGRPRAANELTMTIWTRCRSSRS